MGRGERRSCVSYDPAAQSRAGTTVNTFSLAALSHKRDKGPAKAGPLFDPRAYTAAGSEARSGAAFASSSLLFLAEYFFFARLRFIRSFGLFRAQLHDRSASGSDLLGGGQFLFQI